MPCKYHENKLLVKLNIFKVYWLLKFLRLPNQMSCYINSFFSLLPEWLDLTETFPLAVAIQQHDVNPVSSPQKADLQSVQELGAQAVGMATLVLVHGRYTWVVHFHYSLA